jgi:serine/threonine protein kinase/tetratricopeptide (TPR) repeat protein
MSAPQPSEKSIFLAAIDVGPAERSAFLDRACAGDAALRGAVEALLEAHGSPQRLLDTPVTGAPTIDERQPAEWPGTAVGPYRLLEQIGEGGFGVVYLAEQAQPVRRRVALKVLKPGMDTRQVVARFEAERQALALMDHPHIAKVLDGGQTASGRLYFVMELVRGTPITDFCDEHRLTPRERLGLFLSVCRAVQHAHQKGVIHRDLKPSNVLVALQDGEPAPKVIDFGVAKATGQALTDWTAFTVCGQMVGTPLYMSPEQAGLSGQDVDTRGDIYSLGVVLYELLTGTTPFDRQRFRGASYDEVRRIIREEEPPPPSTRLSTAKELPAVAERRGLEPRRLSGLVRGELDWVVMKCLEKDRERRYESASALALDIERYLNDEPVQAGPPGAGYRLRKFVRRHRGPVLAAAVVVLALVGGTCAASWGLVRADRAWRAEAEQRGLTDAARRAALASAAAERAAKETAQKRLKQVEQANALLASIFRDLDPEEEGGPGLRVQLGERLDQAARLLEGEAVGDPLAVAELQKLLGRALLALGHYEKAEGLLQKACAGLAAARGADYPQTLRTKASLAALYFYRGQYAKAEPLLEEVLRAQAKLGPDDPILLAAKSSLGALYQAQGKYGPAEPLKEEAVRQRSARLGPDDPGTLASRHNLAALYEAQGRYGKAEPLYRAVLQAQADKLGAGHPQTLQTKHSLASLYYHQGRYAEAEPLAREALQGRTARLGADHPQTLKSKANLAMIYQARGRHGPAVALLREALRAGTDRQGAEHPSTLRKKSNLAGLYLTQGRYAEAEPLCREALQAQVATLGPDTLESKDTLGALYLARKQFGRAEPLLAEALRGRTACLGPDHPDTLVSMHNLAVAYGARGKFDRALPLTEELLRRSVTQRGTGHAHTIRLAFQAGMLYRDAGRLDDAVALFEEWLPRGLALPRHPTRRLGLAHGAETYRRAGRRDKAEPLLRELAAEVKETAGADSDDYAEQLARLGRNLLRQRKYAAAEPVLRESLAVGRKAAPDHWGPASVESMLGGALLGQKKYAEAEPLLLSGYEGLRRRQDQMPATARAHLGEALERLVQLYEECGKPDKAAEWRRRLEAHRQAQGKTGKATEK